MKKSFIIFLVLIFSSTLVFSETANQVNILTWWGYLNYPELIARTEQKCNVTISFDQYYSNEEFLRRWDGQKDYYDVIIFSDTIYSIVKKKIPVFKDSELWKYANSYNPIIKKHYFAANYPKNIVYFIHALTGFLWNPKNISLSRTDTILEMFKKSNNKLVVIIDDPVESMKLIEAGLFNHQSVPISSILTSGNFRKMVQNTKVYITNNYGQIYKKSNFAFSFGWSGAAVNDLIESKEHYEFLIHPKLSYVTSDLIAQTSKKSGAQCVADFLSRKSTHLSLQEKYFYFSPYTDFTVTNNSLSKRLYQQFLLSLPNLRWIDSVNEDDFEALNRSWQLIKISLNNRRLEGD